MGNLSQSHPHPVFRDVEGDVVFSDGREGLLLFELALGMQAGFFGLDLGIEIGGAAVGGQLFGESAGNRRLQAEGKLKKEKPLPPVTEDDIPFDIPENWMWVRTGDVIRLQSGQDLPPTEYSQIQCGIPYITGASNFDNGKIILNRWTLHPKAFAEKGDLLFTCKGTIGEMAFLEEEQVHIARQVMGIHSILVDSKYIKYFLMSVVNQIKSQAKSMIPGIERSTILQSVFPMPPLAEQKRIVERLETLFHEIAAL